jgi:hypothetical protein
MRAKVDTMITGNFTSVGTTADAIEVDLLPGREDLAAQLTDQFHDAVRITVGGTPYCGGVGLSPECPALGRSDDLPTGLQLTLHIEDPHISARAGSVNATLTIRQDGPTPLDIDPGDPVVGSIVATNSRTVVAKYVGGIAGVGRNLHLSGGEEATIRVIVGTSRCDGGPGSLLPPGNYGVRAGIGPDEGPPQYFAPEVAITIG